LVGPIREEVRVIRKPRQRESIAREVQIKFAMHPGQLGGKRSDDDGQEQPDP
jgi:hypothetical protein